MTPRQVYPPIALETFSLACGRGDMALVRDLTISLRAGSGLLLRGPNGAGKSTLLLTLAGLLPPLDGRIELAGHDEDDGPAMHHCGHRNAVRPRLTVEQTLRFWAGLNGHSGLDLDAALDRVGLGRASPLDAGYLSAGQQRRLVLARLLVSRRPVWLLDEPSAALDAEGRRLLDGLLAEHLAEGGIAVIATHDDIPVDGLATLELGAKA
jgi:heme exporter protein A